MQCGGHGTVSGIPNFTPLASMRLWSLLNLLSATEAERTEAKRIQSILARADAAAVPGGIRAMSKYTLEEFFTGGGLMIPRVCAKQDPWVWDCSASALAPAERRRRRRIFERFRRGNGTRIRVNEQPMNSIITWVVYRESSKRVDCSMDFLHSIWHLFFRVLFVRFGGAQNGPRALISSSKISIMAAVHW
jgi:hypothetical protein